MDKSKFIERGEAFFKTLQKKLFDYDYVKAVGNGLTNSDPLSYLITVYLDPKAIKDSNCAVGKLVLPGKTYMVHKGERGGLYFWKQKSRGSHMGEYYKKYCSHLSIRPLNNVIKNSWRKTAVKALLDYLCSECWEYNTTCQWDEKASAFLISLFDKPEESPVQMQPQSDENAALGEEFEEEELEGGEEFEEEELEEEEFEDEEYEDEEYEDEEYEEDEEENGEKLMKKDYSKMGKNKEKNSNDSGDDEDHEDEEEWDEDIVCPLCGEPVRDCGDYWCCRACGWEGKMYEDGEEACPECGAEIEEFNGIKFCTKCEWNEDGLDYVRCPCCDAPILESNELKHCEFCDWDERDDWGEEEWAEYWKNHS